MMTLEEAKEYVGVTLVKVMESKYCPHMGGGCISMDCVHFKQGHAEEVTMPGPIFRATFVMREEPRCRLWEKE